MRLRVSELTRAASDVLVVGLASADSNDLPEWHPGAHIDLILGDHMVRQYSLCGDPSERTHYRVAVLLETAGRGGSALVHKTLAVGDEIEARGPRNHFAFEKADRYVFIAGGIGVTPLLPMVAEAQRRGTPFTFTYLGRSRATMAFLDELEAYGDRVTIVARDESDRADVAALLGQPAPGTLVYCCGPESLLSAVGAAGAAWPDEAVHMERFSAAAAIDGAANEVEFAEERTFEVELSSTGEVLTVGPDETLLQVLLAADADVFSDCEEGICSTCEVGVLQGTPDHRDHVLSKAEREAGKVMMVCVSRALSARLVLDL